MKVIVFGGAGFLGSHIVEQLLHDKHEVIVFDMNAPIGNITKQVNFIKGDILDFNDVKAAIGNCDVVYNFAGLADLNEGISRPLDTIKLNIYGNANIMQACAELNVTRFIYASSIYVYSQKGGFYRCSKQASEIYLEEYSRTFGLQYTILRYGTLYGLRADIHNSVYRYLKEGMETRKIHCNNPEEMREYINVKDAARLSVEVMDNKYINERLILSGNYYMKVGDMLNIIKEILGEDVEIIYDRPKEDTNHYSFTPYSFSPKIGNKVVSNVYTDIGQGLLECLEEIYNKVDGEYD